MGLLSDEVRRILTAGRLAHLVTLNRDGSPQVTLVWVGVDGDEIISGHLRLHQKLRNVRRDPRVCLSVETDSRQYLVIHGRGRVIEGGAPELLQSLARVYRGIDLASPAFENPPPGYVLRIAPERVTGVGPWAEPL